MVLLRREKTGRVSRALVALALLSFAGCVLVDALTSRGRALVFSHQVHVVDQELACITCHEDASVYDDPGMPTIDGCAFCHDDLDQDEPPDRRIASLFEEGGSFRAAKVSELGDEVVFRHLKHVEAVEDCATCHHGIEENPAIDESLRVEMDDCTACHSERSVSNACLTCHSYVDTSWAPENHALDWTARHGMIYRRAGSEPINRCSLCHDESSCSDCHLAVPPENHDAFWRLRGHALVARADRQNCATCHQSFDCDACHQEVLPRSHTGMFGGSRSTHCLACHFPVQATGCITCHKATPSHDLGPPKPAWHDPAMNCRACHGQGTLPLLHVDDGSNCNLCHP